MRRHGVPSGPRPCRFLAEAAGAFVPLQAHPATRNSKNDGSGHRKQRRQLSRQRGGLPGGQHSRLKAGRQPQQARGCRVC